MNDSALNRAYVALQGSYWASNALVISFASVFLLARGFSNAEIGVVLAVANLAAAIVQPPLASVADASRRITLTRIAAVLTIASIVFAACLLLVPHLFYATALLFFGLITVHMVLQPIVISIGSFFLTKGRKLNYGLARGIGSAAFALSAALLGVLVDGFGANVLIYAEIILFIVFLFVNARFDTRKQIEATSCGTSTSGAAAVNSNAPDDCGIYSAAENNGNHTAASRGQSSGFMQFARRNARFMVFLLGLMLIALQHNMLNNFMYQVLQSLGGTAADTGLAFSIAGLSEVPIMVGLVFIFKYLRTSTLMRISVLAFTAKAVAFLLAPNVETMLAAQALQMLGNGILMSASVYYVNLVIKEYDQVKGQTFIITACTVGTVLGSFFGGQVLALIGVRGLLVFGAGVSALGAAIAFFAVEDERHRTKPSLA